MRISYQGQLKNQKIAAKCPQQSYCSKDKSAKRNTKKWKEENVINLIELLEERGCLWDIYDNEYTKCDKCEVSYKEIAENLGNRWEISEK